MGCRADNTSTVDCSGRGSCVCGKCECNVRSNVDEVSGSPQGSILGPSLFCFMISPLQEIYGTYCECDNFSCERHEGLLCSGPDHGTCDCGACICKEGWTGTNCACKASTETCIPPGGGPVCSGHGVCECGACKCDVTEEGGRYSGRYCDKCPVS